MSDLRDPLIDAFDAFRGGVAPHVAAPGPAELHRRLDTRRRRGKIAAAAVVTLAVAGTFAVLRTGPGPDDTPGTGTQTGNDETTVEKLAEATLDLPAWREPAAASACASGPTRFNGGAYRGPDGTVTIQQAKDVDVDQDGFDETVIHLTCRIQDAVAFQVVAVRRDGSGALRTVGQVAVQEGDLRAVCSVQATTVGGVKLLVSDDARPDTCSRPSSNQTVTHWRTYTWDGRAFRQTGGPVTFPQLPTRVDLAVRASKLAFTDIGGGMRRGTMTVTVRNNSMIEAPGWWVYLPIPRNATVTSRYGCLYLSPGDTPAASCIGLPLKALAEFPLTITVDVPANVDWPHRVVQVWPPDDYTDSSVGNNDTEYTIGP